jgi:microcystin-dependent protein
MKLLRRFLPLAVVLALSLPPCASAQTIGGAPNTIDYQGKALDAAGALLAPTTPTNYEMTFRIYDAQEGGTVIWAEKQIVTVSKGLFSVRLGEGTATGEGTVLQTNLADAFTAAARFLGVTIAITGQTPTEILPRLAFLATPFAYSANRSITAERLVLNPSSTATPSAINASAISYATQTLTTGDFTLNENNHTIVANAVSGWVNITLPAVTTRREYFIIKTDASQNVVQVLAPPGGTISGTSPFIISGVFSTSGGTGGGDRIKLKVRGESITIQNTGGNEWWVVSDTRDKTPVGTIIALGGTSNGGGISNGGWPAGYWYCDGTQKSRTDILAVDLFAVIGANHGAPNATSFNLPDLRGKFLRAVDGGVGHDDQRNARIPHYAGGASGDAPGSFQWWANGTHTHTFTGSSSGTSSAGSHDHMNAAYTAKGSSVYTGVETPAPGQWGLMRRSAANEGVTASAADVPGAGNQPDILNTPVAIPYDGAHTHTVVPNGTIGATGGASANPTNISVYYFIKY